MKADIKPDIWPDKQDIKDTECTLMGGHGRTSVYKNTVLSARGIVRSMFQAGGKRLSLIHI